MKKASRERALPKVLRYSTIRRAANVYACAWFAVPPYPYKRRRKVRGATKALKARAAQIRAVARWFKVSPKALKSHA